MKFEVSWDARSARWLVRLNNTIYGTYLDKEQAHLDAEDAACDAEQAGCDVQVWIYDQTEERVL
jgi:hypothetical protein